MLRLCRYAAAQLRDTLKNHFDHQGVVFHYDIIASILHLAYC